MSMIRSEIKTSSHTHVSPIAAAKQREPIHVRLPIKNPYNLTFPRLWHSVARVEVKYRIQRMHGLDLSRHHFETSSMENPHEAEQAVLLERIIKNVVSVCYC